MRTIFLSLFLCFSFHIHSQNTNEFLQETTIANAALEGLPTSLVNGNVCAITGLFVDSSTDFVLPGPETLTFQRTYSSAEQEGNLGLGWNANHRERIVFGKAKFIDRDKDTSKDMWKCTVIEQSGARMIYDRPYHSKDEKKSSPLSLKMYNMDGLTNGSSGEISGRTNPKNKKIEWHPNKREFLYYNGAKDCRTFQCKNKEGRFFGLINDKKVNGSSYRYHYHQDFFLHAGKIECYHTASGRIFSELNFTYKGKLEDDKKSFAIETSDQRKIEYKFFTHEHILRIDPNIYVAVTDKHFITHYLEKVSNPSRPTIKYKYQKRSDDNAVSLILYKKSLPNDRYLKLEYFSNKKGWDRIQGEKVKRDLFTTDRVKKLYAPAGTTEDPIAIYSFLYDFYTTTNSLSQEEFEGGKTYVFDANKHKTKYEYDKNQLLTSITKYKGKDQKYRYCQENFIWGRKTNRGNLKSKYLTDSHGNIHYLRNFQYDPAGNILENRLYGNLTGRKPIRVELGEDKLPNRFCECEVKKSTYLHNGLNLKHTETDSNGVTTLFKYEPDTDRLIATFQIYEETVFAREFFEYDKNNALTKKISDDGHTRDKDDLKGVTERHVIEYKTRKIQPIGLPEEEIHSYLNLETNQLQQLKRVTYAYSKEGWIEQQEVYDANNEWCYALINEYDAHGNITKEVDRLGQVITKEYDENDNLIAQEGPVQGFRRVNTYDYMNRLIQESEIHPDGQIFSTSHAYDFMGNRIHTINTYGLKTTYAYDELNRLTAIFQPEVLDEKKNWVTPVIRTQYDVAGNVVQVKDTAGNLTKTSHNIRGQPLRIDYPDETFERFFYRLDGKLEFKRSRDGLKTHYILDHLGRILKEEIYSKDDVLLKSKVNEYKNLRLKATLDENGIKTKYKYNDAGQLEWVIKESRKSQTLYDSLGRPCEIREWFGEGENEYRVSIKKYDLLDRLIEERVQEADGTILHSNEYEYDAHNNRTLVKNGDQITRTEFNHFKNPIKIINAAGEITYTDYDYEHLNANGQKVLKTTTTDARGYLTVDIYDAADRLVLTQKHNSYGILLSQQETFYDLKGNIRRVEDAVVVDNEIIERKITLRTYSADQQIISLIEAFKTPEQKSTYYRYNDLGQLVTLVKPDGMEILYSYDAFGRLHKFYAQDNSFSYVYKYNISDQIIEICDKVNNVKCQRFYNTMGEMTNETLLNGLAVEYNYDALGRTRFLTFPDQSQVEYVYNAVDLLAAHRIVDNKQVYSHIEKQRNAIGQIITAQLPGENGLMTYNYDSMGRCTLIHSLAYQQEVPEQGYDSVGNLIAFESQGRKYSFEYDDLNQLSSEKGHIQHIYSFDSLENRIEKDGQIHTYNALNQLVRKGEENFKYDKNGNLIERSLNGKITTFSYDALDRLISLNKDGKQVNYKYDPFNRRIAKKIENEEEQLFLYIGNEEIGVWQSDRLQEFRMLVKNEASSTAAIEIKNNLYIPHHDLSGNIVCLTDEFGKVVERYRYTAFGETEVLTPAEELLNESAVGNFWQYSSKRLDPESGMTAFGLRYYDAELGRWLTPDPIGVEGGNNLYAYIHNSPLIYKDRFGLFLESVITPYYSYPVYSYLKTKISEAVIPETMFFPSEKFMGTHFDENYDNADHTGCVEYSENYELNQLNFLNSGGENLQLGNNTNFTVGFCNGICNDKKSFADSLLHVGTTINHNVVGTHAASFGLGYDSLRYGLGRYGVYSEAVEKIHENWNKAFDKHPNGYVFWVCHSRGALDTLNALKNFPEKLRERIVIIAVAPGIFIPKNLCHSVVHLVSTHDIVPRLDPVGWWRNRDTVEIVQGSGLDDHYFTNPIYTKKITAHFDKFKEDFS